MAKKAMVLLSGGIDSTTCLAMAIKAYGRENVTALSVFYGQKHKKELKAVDKILNYYKVSGETIDLSSVFLNSDCALLAHSHRDIPEESYEKQIRKTKGEPVATYVPFRNGLFLSVAAGMALSRGCQVLYYGAHRDDAAGNAYPDCSRDFYEAMNRAVIEGSGHGLEILAPFIDCNKTQIVKEGLKMGVPYQYTWSCYEGKDVPCGKCGTCLDRQKAFLENGVTDPALF